MASFAPNPWSYIPILKGRKAEHLALRELAPDVVGSMAPLIQLWDQISAEDSARELVETVRKTRTGWASALTVLVDGLWVSPEALRLSVEAVRQAGGTALPVTSLSRARQYQLVARQLARGSGVVLRLPRPDQGRTFRDLSPEIDDLLRSLGVQPEAVVVVLDMGPLDAAQDVANEVAVIGMLRSLPHLEEWRHVAIAGSSMPAYMTDFPREEVTAIPRSEGWIWQAACGDAGLLGRSPGFGDYAIAHPERTEEPEAPGRALPQTAQMRYATPDQWLMAKGGNIRRGYGPEFPRLLERLVEAAGAHFGACGGCAGDDWIRATIDGEGGTGTAVVWRRIGTVHHLTLVTRQRANLRVA